MGEEPLKSPTPPPAQSLSRTVFLVKHLDLHGRSPGSYIQESAPATFCSLDLSGNTGLTLTAGTFRGLHFCSWKLSLYGTAIA